MARPSSNDGEVPAGSGAECSGSGFLVGAENDSSGAGGGNTTISTSITATSARRTPGGGATATSKRRVALIQTLLMLGLAALLQRNGKADASVAGAGPGAGGAATAAATAAAAAPDVVAAAAAAGKKDGDGGDDESEDALRDPAATAAASAVAGDVAALDPPAAEFGSVAEEGTDDDGAEVGDGSGSRSEGVGSSDGSHGEEELDEQRDRDAADDDDIVIVIATVDGTLAGLSRTSGRILWMRASENNNNNNSNGREGGGSGRDRRNNPHRDPQDAGGTPPVAASGASSASSSELPFADDSSLSSPILRPLVATTTTTSARNAPSDNGEDDEGWRTSAVPGINGLVYLTAAASAAASAGEGGEGGGGEDVTVAPAVADLVSRAPFVDRRGRIYTGSTHSTAFCVDGSTGEVLHVASADVQTPNPQSFDSGNNLHRHRGRGGRRRGGERSSSNVIWLGRVDMSIAIHEPQSGQLDVQFSSSRIMGVQDMLLPGGGGGNEEENENEPSSSSQQQPPWDRAGVSGSHPAGRDTQLERAGQYGDADFYKSGPSSASSSTVDPSSRPSLVATPNGNVAYRNEFGRIEWIADECFETPVAFAVDSASGTSLQVDVVPDAILPNDRSADYLTREMERQAMLLLTDSRSNSDDDDHEEEEEEEGIYDEQTIVGSLSSGELFAVPLGRRSSQAGFWGGRSNRQRDRRRPSTGSSSASRITHSGRSRVSQQLPSSSKPNAPVASSVRHQTNRPSLQQQYHGGISNYGAPSGSHVVGCHAGAPNFPGCLVDSSLGDRPDGQHLFSEGPQSSDYHNGAVVPFYYPDLGYIPPPNHYTLKDAPSPSRRRYKKMLRILGSWLPPTIALLFVLSFELGRRKRQLDSENQPELDSSKLPQLNGSERSHTTNVGVIRVFDDVILGYGGHGTVVYKGTLEGRQVAVKRMLRAYHASADREISLLIESDGHPNVVRYFLKEVRGDFVYLALELCDLSLHDLIVRLRARSGPSSDLVTTEKENVAPLNVADSTKTILFQIASGVKHLHHLRIVHRDLKPMNILLADARKKSMRAESSLSVLDIFDHGDYVAKISDMGLGKQLVGQSSYGASLVGDVSSFRETSNGAQSSIVGPGPGSVGWQAPEVMAVRIPSDASVPSDGSSPASDLIDASPLDNAVNGRTSRSSDIFSLGCIFYSTLLPGCHPFGDWYEREANIMHNRPNIGALEKISPDAYDLVSSMIERNQGSRPTAKQICEHSFFWPLERRLAFLCDFSDRLETESAKADGEACSAFATKALAIERNASKIVGLAWDSSLENELVSNVQRFRTYDPSSVRDLLRLIRNKHHHFDELPSRIKSAMGSNTDGLMKYFEEHFPRLLIHCYNVCREILSADDPLSTKYSISPVKRGGQVRRLGVQVSTITEGTEACPIGPLVEEKSTVHLDEQTDDGTDGEGAIDLSTQASQITDDGIEGSEILKKQTEANEFPSDLDEAPTVLIASAFESAIKEAGEACREDDNIPHAPDSAIKQAEETCAEYDSTPGAPEPTGDLVIWEGSTASKTFNCRGWSRSDDEWERRVDAALHRKRDTSNLIRCAEDPRFRTRLCNHWDASQGTYCPMLRKKKCIFAHGPVELRVKEGKRNRWGKLVDSNGDSSSPRHSGGEDTYGAARSIETERKQEGKWNTDKSRQQQKGKKNTNRKKKTSK